MSADNGVYILRTPAVPVKEGSSYRNRHNEHEYRVAHCAAIDNLDYSDLYLALYFGDCEVYDNWNEASRVARHIALNVGFLEYGVVYLEKDCHFPNMTSQAAHVALDCYVGATPLDT